LSSFNEGESVPIVQRREIKKFTGKRERGGEKWVEGWRTFLGITWVKGVIPPHGLGGKLPPNDRKRKGRAKKKKKKKKKSCKRTWHEIPENSTIRPGGSNRKCLEKG